MEDEHSFEQIREDIEARQRSILWPDYLRATRNVYEFLWNGDPKARPVQRIGLAIFGLQFLLVGISVVYASSSEETGWSINPGKVAGAVSVLFSLRLLRNVFLRSPKNLLKLAA